MERFSPKNFINFDNLIKRIDIDIDSSLEKYNDQKLRDIGILKISDYNEWFLSNFSNNFKVEFFEKIDSYKPNPDSWPESMKVVDYLKQIRMKTIDDLKKAQEETIEFYKINSDRFKSEKIKENNIKLSLKSSTFKLTNLLITTFKIDTSWSEPGKIIIKGLSSLKTLHFKANTLEVDFSIKNLPSLTSFYLSISVFGICNIDEKIVTRLLEQVPNIQELHFNGDLSFFNLDNFVNLRVLKLSGKIKDFNFKLFKNLCNQLEDIKISIYNINEKSLYKLFDGFNFPYLRDFTLMRLSTNKLKNEFMNGFSTLRHLNILDCDIELIEHDLFSNLEQLTSLDLRRKEKRIKILNEKFRFKK